MTNGIAIALGVLVIGSLVVDAAANDGAAALFLARRLFDLVETLAIWR